MSGETQKPCGGVVFDLDGTVVRLAVDWQDVEASVRRILRETGIDPEGRTVWALLEIARKQDQLDAVEPTINEHELNGADRSDSLPLADTIPSLSVPVAICSLNCEAACRRAMEVHGLTEAVDAVIGRDTIRPWKPDPAPLREAIERIEISPDRAVFIGDSARDARTADAADVPFLGCDEAITRLRA